MKAKISAALVAAAMAASAAAPSPLSADCRVARAIHVPPTVDEGGRVVEPAKHAYQLADGSRLFVGRFTIDADGAPHAYHPLPGTGLDRLSNAGRPGHWFGLATGELDRHARHRCLGTGEPVIQGAADPAPGYYVATTSMHDPGVEDCRSQRRYVNSETIPFVALPPVIAGIEKRTGPFVVVSRPGRIPVMALMADQAPAYGIGEGSMELARRLGYSPDPKTGGFGLRELVFLVLPERSGFPADARAIEHGARMSFAAWGGEARLSACAAAVRALPR